MTPKLNDLSLKYIVRMGRKTGEKIFGKKKLQSNAEHLLICCYDSKSLSYVQSLSSVYLFFLFKQKFIVFNVCSVKVPMERKLSLS